ASGSDFLRTPSQDAERLLREGGWALPVVAALSDVISPEFSPDGRFLMLRGNGRAVLRDLSNPALPERAFADVYNFVFAPDSSKLMVEAAARQVRVHDLLDPEAPARELGTTVIGREQLHFGFSSDSRFALIQDASENGWLYDLSEADDVPLALGQVADNG